MSSLKKLLSDSMIYGLSSIVGRFLNYLLVPLYTYTLVSSGNYGVVTNVYAYTALLLVLLTFGMETTFFYFANNNKDNHQKVFSTSLYMVGSVCVCFLAVVMVFSTSISSALGYNEHPEYIRIMATVVSFDAFQAILFAYLRFQGRAWKFAALKLLFIVMNIGINLFVFITIPHIKVSNPDAFNWYTPEKQVYYIFLINLLCTAPITLAFLPEIRCMRHGIDFSLVKQMLRYTWPLLILGLAGILNQVADKICFRFIMPGTEGDAQLGIYGACVKIAMIMAMITQAFRYAYEPFVFGNQRNSDSKEMQAKVMKYFVMFTLLAFLAVTAYMDLLKFIIADKYWDGLKAVPIVMMAEIFMGIYFNLSFWYKLLAKTWWGAIFSITGCIVLLAINFIFVPKYGFMACAWGGFCGYGVCMIMSYFIGRKQYPVPYPIVGILGYFTLAIALFYAMSVVDTGKTWLNLAINTLLLVAYTAVALYNERELTTKVLKKIKK